MNAPSNSNKTASGFGKSPIGYGPSAFVLLLILVLNFQPVALFAGSSPSLIPYQGRLTNPQGVPYTNGQYTLAFTLYDQPVGGTVIWGPETHYKVGVINGMVNVFLGSINTVSNVDFGQTRHLGITIYADNNPNNPAPEMVPRQMIVPAFWAKNAEKLNGYDWSQIFGANSPVGSIPGGKIQGQTITAGQIKLQTITAAQIADGTITSQQLSGAIITSNQIVLGSINAQNIADGAVTLPKLSPRLAGTNVPMGGLAVSDSSGNWSSAGTYPNYVEVTNLQIKIACSGRPIVITLMPDGYTAESPDLNAGFLRLSSSGLVDFRIDRDSTPVAKSFAQSTTSILTLSGSSIFFIDTPSLPSGPATLTYRLYVRPNGVSLTINHLKLVAYEL